jgi:hypothetical protein
MRIAAIAIAALAAGLSPADGASLRQTTTLQVLRARHAEGKTPKTAYNGEKFHSILDHPSTAHFFEGKDEAEITDMVESAVFAHFVGHGHSLHKKKKARVNEAELASSSFVQLAAAHGVDFKTLKALHKKSGKGHHDMEIWWREQALHASVHVDNGPNVGPEDELRASVSPLELSFMEVFQAETADKKTRAAKTATASVTAKATMAMASNAVTAPQVTGEETTATTTRVYAEARAKVVRVAQDTKAETKASRALDDASDTAFLSEKTLQGEDQKLLKKMSTLSEAKIRAHLKVKVGNGLGDRCGWSCDDGSPCTSHKCTYHAASRSGNQHCYCNVDCSSGTCKSVFVFGVLSWPPPTHLPACLPMIPPASSHPTISLSFIIFYSFSFQALEMEARAKAAAVTVCTTVGPSAITPPARRTPSARLAVVLEMGADCSPRWAQGVQVHAIIMTPPALRLSLATKMLIAVLTAALATVAVSCPR